MQTVSASKNKGFVLLSVMFSATLLLTAAVAFAWFAKTELQRAAVRDFKFRARCAAQSAFEYAMTQINADNNAYDSETELLYSPLGGFALEIGGFNVDVKIRPLDDKISVQGIFLPDGNTLRSEYEKPWENIFSDLGRADLANVVLDFMDKDDVQRLSSREQKDFLNRPVLDLAELKLIEGVNDELLYGTKKKKICLNSFISCAGSDKININSAEADLFCVLFSGVSAQIAKQIVAARRLIPFKNVSELKSIPGFPAAELTKMNNVLSVKSTQFEIDIKVKDKTRQRNFRVVAERGGNKILRWEE